MPISPPAAAVSLPPGIAGNPQSEIAGMVALTVAELAIEVKKVFDAYPTTEPVAAGQYWWDSGTLKKSGGISPVITDQPDSIEIADGEDASFTVSATNATSYQWYRNTGGGWSVISGATSTTLTVLAADVSMTGYQYRVVVTGAGGTVTSDTAALSVSGLDEFYTVSGFSDSNHFQSAANVGLNSLGTVRLVFKLLAVPGSGLKFICGKVDSGGSVGGWYIRTGQVGTAALSVYSITSTGAQVSPTYTLLSADIGRIFVLHTTIRGGKLRMFLGGTEVGAGTSCGTPTNPTSAEKLCIGKWQHAAGISSTDVAIVSLATSTAALTDQEISDDAAQILADTNRFDCPDLPSQTERWDAIDIGAAWVSRGPGTLSLVKTGTPTITGLL